MTQISLESGERPPSHRVLMIAPTSFFADYGCHVRILEQARRLTARRHEIVMCTYHSGRDVAGLEIYRTPRIPWRRAAEVGSSWHKLILDILLFILVLRTARRFRPNVLHAYLHEGALIGILVGRLLDIPLVFDFQGSLTSEMVDHRFLKPSSPFLRPLRSLERWIDRRPVIVLANSHHSACLLVSHFGVAPSRIRAVPDCVDTERFRPPVEIRAEETIRAREAWNIPPEALVIVYLGLLAPYQGTDLLLHAFKLVDPRLNVHLLIMGFPDEEKYRKMAGKLGIADRVTFTGAVPYAEAHHMLALGNIAVGPKISETEGSGKLLNYMAMGLPTVAFDTPVSREYLGDAGVLTPLGDVGALSAALAHLAQNCAERTERGRQLRWRAIEQFGRPAAIDEIESAYGIV